MCDARTAHDVGRDPRDLVHDTSHGPRGVTSIHFAVLAYVELGARDASLILKLAGSTVLLSLIQHGVTAEPLARWLGQRAVITDGGEGSRTGHVQRRRSPQAEGKAS
ncbi:hypothetical protein ACF073_09165 [Streptomyces sp. NPDC015171]|uniref:hypothetical protein n=1 Tax=Streptomyces sp. NPDC015171 TaxID=3364945 RepID=UPI0036FC9A04